jgi:hypothetical protein
MDLQFDQQGSYRLLCDSMPDIPHCLHKVVPDKGLDKRCCSKIYPMDSRCLVHTLALVQLLLLRTVLSDFQSFQVDNDIVDGGLPSDTER